MLKVKIKICKTNSFQKNTVSTSLHYIVLYKLTNYYYTVQFGPRVHHAPVMRFDRHKTFDGSDINLLFPAWRPKLSDRLEIEQITCNKKRVSYYFQNTHMYHRQKLGVVPNWLSSLNILNKGTPQIYKSSSVKEICEKQRYIILK